MDVKWTQGSSGPESAYLQTRARVPVGVARDKRAQLHPVCRAAKGKRANNYP
ncbi:MAG: hypothetical protein JWP57_1939 [Spirosoma sp.]|nr:hypothetical protein [Spirosoma sp.]